MKAYILKRVVYYYEAVTVLCHVCCSLSHIVTFEWKHRYTNLEKTCLLLYYRHDATFAS
jgi:hypothetical protein